MNEKKTGLFDQLYAAGKEAFDALKKPMIKNKVKRRLNAAFDDADLKIREAELKINKVRENFEDYNINEILQQKSVIKQAEDLKAQIKEEYLELFGKEMVVEDEE